jgi:hypothetical protein
MTEGEWQKSLNGSAMFAVVKDRGSDRLWRLFAVACVRIVHDRSLGLDDRRALDATERVADDALTEAEWQAARALAAEAAHRAHLHEWETEARENFCVTDAWNAAWEVRKATEAVLSCLAERFDATQVNDGLLLPDMLREIFGNPFQWKIADPAWYSANDGAVRRLATAIYGGGAFEHLPVLADALEDAGCGDGELLGHLRSPGPHARGCWALDLVLGRE